MAVLVTGGAGYIGSVAVEQLLAAGEEVVVFDNFSTGHRNAVARGACLVEGDILDVGEVSDLFEEHDIETVMHFAAYSLVGESVENPGNYFENNVSGALSILNGMVEAGVRRFILSSTAAVYGNSESSPIDEEMPTRPLSPYGLSKRMIEEMLAWFDTAYDFRYVSLRYFNACGASPTFGEDHDPETHLIPLIIQAAQGQRKDISVFGTDYDTPDGTCIRDYIHIQDLADAHLKAMAYLRDGKPSNIVNLGNSVGNSVMEVIEAVKRVTQTDFKVRKTARRAGDADKLVASSEKARKLLGWEPRKGDIETIVKDAWAWSRVHPNGYEDRS